MAWQSESVLSLISQDTLFANDKFNSTDLAMSLLSLKRVFRHGWIQMLKQYCQELCSDFILQQAFFLWQPLQ